MEDFTFEPVPAAEAFAAPQAAGTHALVQNPFAFEAAPAVEMLAAPQGPGTNALVQSPFAWAE